MKTEHYILIGLIFILLISKGVDLYLKIQKQKAINAKLRLEQELRNLRKTAEIRARREINLMLIAMLTVKFLSEKKQNKNKTKMDSKLKLYTEEEVKQIVAKFSTTYNSDACQWDNYADVLRDINNNETPLQFIGVKSLCKAMMSI